ncbi:MAG TPA: pilus assembly protein TadG-related protein [Marmoricola sp.]|nr:pilus assembly protein TadG-related protein [Marmoricola sp.]
MSPIRLNRRRDEAGAVAVLIAVLATVLLVIAAFVVDLGMAYVSKRQLQTSADAAALAAASVYAQYPGSCSQLLGNTDYLAEAQQAADEIGEDNRKDQSESPLEVSCPADGTLQVRYTNSGETKLLFGTLAVDDDAITTAGVAAAKVGVSPAAGIAVRPVAMCSAALPPFDPAYGSFVRMDSPGDGHRKIAACPDAGSPGNWWTIDCPEERTGSTSQLEQQVSDGCKEGVSIAGSGSDAATLTIALTANCPSATVMSEKCLSGDPGQMDSGHIEESWRRVIDAQSPIVIPVFCVPPQCTSSTLHGTGTNAVFPVYKLASVVVCGYHFGRTVKYARPTVEGDACHGNTLSPIPSDESRDNYMHLVLVPQQTSGGTAPTTCRLGAECDGGLRRALLSE